MKHLMTTLITAALLFSPVLFADITPKIKNLQTEWAKIKYRIPEDHQAESFKELAKQAKNISSENSREAAPLIWEAIILSSQAGAQGGLGALSLVKQAKELLEKAEKIDPNALQGSIYTSLGSLYYQVPGWPLGFGSNKKARKYLQKALSINPNGIDSNYFYGDFLMEQKNYKAAITAFTKALNAPDRDGRPIADAGRRQEIHVALTKAKEQQSDY